MSIFYRIILIIFLLGLFFTHDRVNAQTDEYKFKCDSSLLRTVTLFHSQVHMKNGDDYYGIVQFYPEYSVLSLNLDNGGVKHISYGMIEYVKKTMSHELIYAYFYTIRIDGQYYMMKLHAVGEINLLFKYDVMIYEDAMLLVVVPYAIIDNKLYQCVGKSYRKKVYPNILSKSQSVVKYAESKLVNKKKPTLNQLTKMILLYNEK